MALNSTYPYIDGTIKLSKGVYTLSAKGGNSDGGSFIESYSSIKGTYKIPHSQGAGGEPEEGPDDGSEDADQTNPSGVFE